MNRSFFSGFASFHFRQHRVLLLIGSVVLVLSGIILHNRGLLPLDGVTFSFFSFVTLLFALYRPAWAFLLFIAVLPLEIINLAPASLGVAIRPYQWLAALLLAAVALLFLSGRLPFRLFRPQWFDGLPILMALGAFIALINAPVPGVAFKQALVVTSFVGIYFLGRIFFRTLVDVRQALPFFLLSSSVVLGYAVWQNVRFLAGEESFQVMAGRPNATLSEADWLGMFALLSLSVGAFLLCHFIPDFLERGKKTAASLGIFFTSLYLTLVFVVLILSVARSAWLGAIALLALIAGRGLLLWRSKGTALPLRETLHTAGLLLFTSLLAVLLVASLHLSPFPLFDRIQSTASGWQNITVSCERADTVLPEKLRDMAELAAYDCRHIMLEEKAAEREAGRFVREVYRDDPNVAVRRDIYQTVGRLALEHPFSGIGWGSAAFFLGSDERGAGLNASNLFFEVWLGSGLLGAAALVILWSSIAWHSFLWYRQAEGAPRLFALFLFATLIGFGIFNAFNSGILLGFFFISLSLGALALEKDKPL